MWRNLNKWLVQIKVRWASLIPHPCITVRGFVRKSSWTRAEVIIKSLKPLIKPLDMIFGYSNKINLYWILHNLNITQLEQSFFNEFLSLSFEVVWCIFQSTENLEWRSWLLPRAWGRSSEHPSGCWYSLEIKVWIFTVPLFSQLKRTYWTKRQLNSTSYICL